MLTPADPKAHIKARNSYEKTQVTIDNIRLVPSKNARKLLIGTHLNTQINWAVPLTHPVQHNYNGQIFDTVVNSKRFKWYCRARFFADNINLHPHTAGAMQALQNAYTTRMHDNKHLQHAISLHSNILDLEPILFNKEIG